MKDTELFVHCVGKIVDSYTELTIRQRLVVTCASNDFVKTSQYSDWYENQPGNVLVEDEPREHPIVFMAEEFFNIIALDPSSKDTPNYVKIWIRSFLLRNQKK